MKCIRTPRRGPRYGATLVELLITLTVLAVILTTSTVTLYRLLHAQSAGTIALAESLTVSRLARDLRRDAHAAASANIVTGDDQTTLTLSGSPHGDVVYHRLGNQLLRRAQTTANSPVTEDYRLGNVTIELNLTESKRLITLQLLSIPPSQAESPGLATPLPHQPRTQTTIQAAIPSP